MSPPPLLFCLSRIRVQFQKVFILHFCLMRNMNSVEFGSWCGLDSFIQSRPGHLPDNPVNRQPVFLLEALDGFFGVRTEFSVCPGGSLERSVLSLPGPGPPASGILRLTGSARVISRICRKTSSAACSWLTGKPCSIQACISAVA